MAEVDAELTIVVDGSEWDRLEALAVETDVTITFVGEVPPAAVVQYYCEAGVFVLPSVEGEGMPNFVLKDMAWGLPVVTTDSGGLPTVVTDGETGYLVPMREPEALTTAIEQLIDDQKRREQMGERARKYAQQNHSWDSHVQQLDQIYRECATGTTQADSDG